MARGTTLRNFRCDGDRWEAFLAACSDEGTDASSQLRRMIDGWLAARGRREPALAAAWDDGYEAGYAFGYEYAQDTYDGPTEDPTPNPHA